MIIFFVQAQKNNNQCVVISAKLPILLAKQAYYSIIYSVHSHLNYMYWYTQSEGGREELGGGVRGGKEWN